MKSTTEIINEYIEAGYRVEMEPTQWADETGRGVKYSIQISTYSEASNSFSPIMSGFGESLEDAIASLVNRCKTKRDTWQEIIDIGEGRKGT